MNDGFDSGAEGASRAEADLTSPRVQSSPGHERSRPPTDQPSVTARPSAAKLETCRIPEELKIRPRWVNWRYVERGGKRTKVPLNPQTGSLASCNDPATWGIFREALNRLNRGGVDGIGFQLGESYVGIDLDKCRDPDKGAIEPWAQEIIRQLNSYTEISPSGSGVHTWVKGNLPVGARRKGRVEMYDRDRYFTVTGRHLAGTSENIEERTAELEDLHARLFHKRKVEAKVGGANRSASDAELIECAHHAHNGAKFARLWRGDFSGYASQSEGDLALCLMLAFWTGRDAERIDGLFRQSGLHRPKWDERHGGDGRTYGQITIDKAIENTSEVWRPHRRGAKRSQTSGGRNEHLPRVVVNDRQLRDITHDALKALEAANNPPELFVRSGRLARVRADENGRPIIDDVGESELRGRLARVADYVRLSGPKGRTQCPPPEEVVRDIVALGKWPFPALEGIVGVPILRADGEILSSAGYDPVTHLVHWPAVGLRLPEIPPNPSENDAAEALALINEAIGEFPFDDEASRANAFGLLFTPIMRPAIPGPVPLACIDAPQGGTGKGLLASVVSIIGTGREAEMMSAPLEEEEWRKRITALLYEGATFVCIDNVFRWLRSTSLSSALTSGMWRDRILGKTATLTVPQRATWVANGNNMQLLGDLSRRSYWIRLDAKTPHPWKRKDFKHTELIPWVHENRGRLLQALLTIVRSWYAAGKPAAGVPVMGSFESWARTIGSVLKHAGTSGTGGLGFLANLEERYQQADESATEWGEFLHAILETFGGEAFTVKELAERMRTDETLREALPGELAEVEKLGSFQHRLGRAFSSRIGTRYADSGIHIERVGRERRATRWRIMEH